MWHRGVVFITTVQFHSKKFKFWLCAGSNLPYAVSDVCDDEKLRQWSWPSTPQKTINYLSIAHPHLHFNFVIVFSFCLLFHVINSLF